MSVSVGVFKAGVMQLARDFVPHKYTISNPSQAGRRYEATILSKLSELERKQGKLRMQESHVTPLSLCDPSHPRASPVMCFHCEFASLGSRSERDMNWARRRGIIFLFVRASAKAYGRLC
jgi:hypothetical protein